MPAPVLSKDTEVRAKNGEGGGMECCPEGDSQTGLDPGGVDGTVRERTIRDGGIGGRRSEVAGLFDRRVLDDLADALTPAELAEYLALLHPTVKRRLHDLLSFQDRINWDEFHHAAHALAGGAACYGLTGLSAAARRLETAARIRDQLALKGLLEELVALTEPSLDVVADWMGSRQ